MIPINVVQLHSTIELGRMLAQNFRERYLDPDTCGRNWWRPSRAAHMTARRSASSAPALTARWPGV